MFRSADTREKFCVGWSNADKWSLQYFISDKPKSVIRDFEEQSVMNYYQLLKEIYYFTHYNCYISCVF